MTKERLPVSHYFLWCREMFSPYEINLMSYKEMFTSSRNIETAVSWNLQSLG